MLEEKVVWYLAVALVPRAVLAVTVSHSLFTLQVYGGAGIRILCGKIRHPDTSTVSSAVLFKSLYPR